MPKSKLIKDVSSMDLLGRMLGQYHVIRHIGKGGMGEVFEALDTTLKRRVAIKVINRKHRLDVLAKNRFLKEARILSQIDHAHICRVFEFIERDDVDCLVVEYVDGVQLEDLMDTGLDMAKKLKIARQMLEGVHAAHQKGIIHRDLKPGNTMVTKQGRVKILDFGVAMVVSDPDETHRREWPSGSTQMTFELNQALETHLSSIVGTPKFMSPEQARGETANVTSDIYSLGLILQYLFTEKEPYPDASSSVGLLWRVMNAETLPIENLDPELTGLIRDMKNLQMSARPSVGQVLDRLDRFMDRPKRRAKRIAAFSVGMLLVAATVFSSFAYVRANKAQQEVVSALDEAKAVNRFLADMLTAASPDKKGRDVKMVELLDDALQKAETAFQRPEVSAAVHDTLGTTFFHIGEFDKAGICFERAMDLRTQAFGATHTLTLDASHNLANVRFEQSQFENAERLQRFVCEQRSLGAGKQHADTLVAMNLYALILNARGKHGEAERIWRETIRYQRQNPDVPPIQRLVTQENLALCLMSQHRLNDAEVILRESLREKTKQLGESHPRTLDAMNNLAATLMRVGKTKEAVKIQRAVFNKEMQVLGERHPNTFNSMSNLGDALMRDGQFEEAEKLILRSSALNKEIMGENHPSSLSSPCRIAMLEMRKGMYKEAAEHNQQGIDALAPVIGAHHPTVLNQRRVQAKLTNLMGHPDESIAQLKRLLTDCRAHLEQAHPTSKGVARDLTERLREQGLDEDAQVLDKEFGPFFSDYD